MYKYCLKTNFIQQKKKKEFFYVKTIWTNYKKWLSEISIDRYYYNFCIVEFFEKFMSSSYYSINILALTCLERENIIILMNARNYLFCKSFHYDWNLLNFTYCVSHFIKKNIVT